MPEQRIKILFHKYLAKTLNQDENEEFVLLIEQEQNKAVIIELINSEFKAHEDNFVLQQGDANATEKILEKIIERAHEIKPEPTKRLLLHQSWKINKYAAAAILFCILAAGTILGLVIYKKKGQFLITAASKQTKVILPATNSAVLISSDGQRIVLKDTSGKVIVQKGIVQVLNTRGTETIWPKSIKTKEMLLETERANVYSMVLPDGSKVWLNAMSSIRFPNIFNGNTRAVSITGEVYFEVAHNPAKPFIVSVNDMKIEVLGTHFNINSYDDEACIKTTLLQGKIKIDNKKEEAFLFPGQQSQLDKSGRLKIIDNADINEVMGWRQGNFVFENYDIHEVMRQLQRWYDVDVEYRAQNIEQHFEGIISRNVPLSEVLEMLGKSSDIKFTLIGKKIIINQ